MQTVSIASVVSCLFLLYGVASAASPAIKLAAPSGIALDRSGNVYVASSGEYKIKKLSANGKALASWSVSPGSDLFSPKDLAVDAHGYVYTVTNGILRLSPRGKLLASWNKGALGQPIRLTVDAGNNVFALYRDPVKNPAIVAGSFTARVMKLSSRGKTLAVFRDRGPRYQGVYPTDVAVGGQGNVFISFQAVNNCPPRQGDCADHYLFIDKLSPKGKLLARLGGRDPFGDRSLTYTSGGLAVDKQGSIYLGTLGRVVKLSRDVSKEQRTFYLSTCGPANIGPVTGVALDQHGNVYATINYGSNVSTGSVEKFSANGKLLASWGQCPPSSALKPPPPPPSP